MANTFLARTTPAHTIAITASGPSDEETPPIVTHDHQAELPSAASGARWGTSFHSLCGKEMFEVTDEIDRAIESLQLKSKLTRLSRPEAEEVNRTVLARFSGGKGRRWWWEAFPQSESVSFEDGLGYQRVHLVVPNPSERCWLIVEGQESGPYPVYEASPEEAVSIIGECFGFEYYIVPKDLSWLVCENHHGRVIGCGKFVEEAIRRVAA